MSDAGPRPLAAALLLASLAAVVVTPAQAQRLPVPVTGREAQVTLQDGTELRGELLEATRQALLLAGSPELQRTELGQVARVRVRQHDFTGNDALAWLGVGALVSGVGMAAACSTVESASCGSVLPAVALSFGLIGGLFSISMTSSGWRELPVDAEALRPYARFPQGAPPGFGRRP